MRNILSTVVAFLAVVVLASAEEKAAIPLTVVNEEGKVVVLAPQDWRKLPRRKVEVKEKDGKAATYEGVSLTEVLRSAGVPFDGHLRGPRVAQHVLVEAADRYRAAFALAEVDPSVTDKVVLVADRVDGKPLGATAGPYRIVVLDDKIRSRWVRQVVKVSVMRATGAGSGK